MSAPVIVIAATAHELAWAEGLAPILACGIGPVEAAAATADLLERVQPAGVLHVGIAGARSDAGLPIRSVVVGSSARYTDLHAAIDGLERVAEPDPRLVAALIGAFGDITTVEIATTAAVGRSSGCPVEAMEGFGVLRAAARAGVPAVELRVVSNMVEEPDRARWDFAGALALLAEIGPRALAACQSELGSG